GSLLALGLGRWPRAAFIVAVIVSVVGTPSLYLSGLVVLLATLAPFTDRPPTGQEERDPAAGFMAVAA
ncbi:MAG TPA: hypothetical protein VFC81_02755, partial [Verrucomicrobiae bacterium]|nr:hypothetical protein [Verrucomicrobiae bacterium]